MVKGWWQLSDPTGNGGRPRRGLCINDHCERQVWIAGGIGITPFLARLDHLAAMGNKQRVDLFYATRCD